MAAQVAPTAPIATVFSPSPLTVVTPPVSYIAPNALNFYTSVQPATHLLVPVFPPREHFDIAKSINFARSEPLSRLSITTRKPGIPHHFYSRPIEETHQNFDVKPEAPFPVYGLPSKPVGTGPIHSPIQSLGSIPLIRPQHTNAPLPPALPELPSVAIPETPSTAAHHEDCDFDDNSEHDDLPTAGVFAPQPPSHDDENRFPSIAATITSNKPPLLHGGFHPALPEAHLPPLPPVTSVPSLPSVPSVPALPALPSVPSVEINRPSHDTIHNNHIQSAQTPTHVHVVHNPITDNDRYNSAFSTPDGIKVSEEGQVIDTDKWKGVVAKRGSYEYVSPEGIPIKVKWIADHEGFRIVE